MKKGITVAVVILLIFLIGGTAVLLRPTHFINVAGNMSRYITGYRFETENVLFPSLSRAQLNGFKLTREGDKNHRMELIIASAQVENGLEKTIRGEIERIHLKEPRFTFYYKDGEEKNSSDILGKIPPVRSMKIVDGVFEFFFDKDREGVTFSSVNLDVQDFSPESGGKANFEGNFSFSLGHPARMTGKGRCRGTVRLGGLRSGPEGTVKLEISGTDIRHGEVVFGNVSMTVNILFRKDIVDVSSVMMKVGSIDVKEGMKSKALGGLELTAKGLYETKKKRFCVDRVRGRSRYLGDFRGSWCIGMQDDYSWQAQCSSSGLDLERVFSLLKPFIEDKDFGKWSVRGKGAADMSLQGRKTGDGVAFDGRGSFSFTGGGFTSGDGTKAGQGIDGRIDVKFRFPSSKPVKGHVEAHSEVSGGEYLWGAYYKDGKKEKLTVSAQADMTAGRMQMNGTADLCGTGDYSYSGSINEDGWSFQGRGKQVSHEKLYTLFFRDYVNRTIPVLHSVSIDGYSDIVVDARKDGNLFLLKGMAETTNSNVNIPGLSIAARQMSMHVPFRFSRSQGPSVSSEATPAQRTEDAVSNGRIDVKKIEGGPVTIEELKIPLQSGENVLRTAGEVTVPVFGGKVSLASWKLEDALSDKRKVTGSMDIEGLSLGELFKEFFGISMSGTLNGRFPVITYSGNLWATRGSITAEVFGGKVKAENIFVKNLFSRSRRIDADIYFHDISLEKVTESVKVGKMSGIVDGSIKGFEIEYGQPSRFVLDIDSKNVKGVVQQISVDAIENISLLGTGSEGLAAVLNSGLNRFFKSYPYSRIGMRCTLENDRFHVRGKIFEDGKEYLIRRAFLRGIDVVNQNAQNVISFKDMQERVGRIFAGAASYNTQ